MQNDSPIGLPGGSAARNELSHARADALTLEVTVSDLRRKLAAAEQARWESELDRIKTDTDAAMLRDCLQSVARELPPTSAARRDAHLALQQAGAGRELVELIDAMRPESDGEPVQTSGSPPYIRRSTDHYQYARAVWDTGLHYEEVADRLGVKRNTAETWRKRLVEDCRRYEGREPGEGCSYYYAIRYTFDPSFADRKAVQHRYRTPPQSGHSMPIMKGNTRHKKRPTSRGGA